MDDAVGFKAAWPRAALIVVGILIGLLTGAIGLLLVSGGFEDQTVEREEIPQVDSAPERWLIMEGGTPLSGEAFTSMEDCDEFRRGVVHTVEEEAIKRLKALPPMTLDEEIALRPVERIQAGVSRARSAYCQKQ